MMFKRRTIARKEDRDVVPVGGKRLRQRRHHIRKPARLDERVDFAGCMDDVHALETKFVPRPFPT
ncbi:hypothetical protein D3C83_317380 [compost metagenome]